MISGELPTIVRVPPSTMHTATGSITRASATPLRPDRRETTGRNSAITEGFCIVAEVSPAVAEAYRIKRSSSPLERRSSQIAMRFSRPVRSSPALSTIVAITLITAVPANPWKICSDGTSPVSPSITSTSSAVTSLRSFSQTNITIVKPTSASTSIISMLRTAPLSASSRSIVQPEPPGSIARATAPARGPPLR